MLIYPKVLCFRNVQLMFTMMLCLKVDNTSLDPNDKFSNVPPLLDKMDVQCLPNYLPEQTVSIVESVVCYFGEHGCKKFMKSKPVKFGYKLWVAATPL